MKLGEEKQEHEFFIVPQKNRNIILGRDLLKQFGVCIYYDLGCIRVGNLYKTSRRPSYFFYIQVNH